MKIVTLKRKLKATREQKIKAIKDQHFELSASLRDDEKKIVNQIQETRNDRIMRRRTALFYRSFNNYTITGCFVQPAIGEFPVRIEFYPYATWLNIYLTTTIKESEPIKDLWKQMHIKQKTQAKNIIELASEYHLIVQIFRHLECSDGIFTMERKQILPYLESNPIFNLITLPPKQRSNFTTDEACLNSPSCYSYDDNKNINGFYQNFSYRLPYQCSIKRFNDNVIISSPFFAIYLKIDFDNKAYTLPLDYAKYYLGFKRNNGRRVDFHIGYTFKWRIVLPWNWKYRKQLKKLQKEIEENISIDHYFKSFNWEPMRMQAVITGNVIRAAKV